MNVRSIILVMAVAENGAIGHKGRLPWRLSDDLKHFKKITMRHCIVMGRKTFESFPKPLPGRPHIIITHQGNYHSHHENCHVVHSIQEAITCADQMQLGDIYLVGGASIVQEALASSLIHKAWITEVKASVEADTFLNITSLQDWEEIQRTQYLKDKNNQYSFDIVLLQKN